ncbi:MAG: cyclase family protein [Candidatus Nitrosocosmicus sp.]
MFCGTHVGTHIDATFHFNKNGITMKKYHLKD